VPSRLRRILLGAFTVGLALSISLAELALAGLAVALLLPGRDVAQGARLRWPLIGPLLVFAGWTLVCALASDQPLRSLTVAKSLLVLATFYVVLHTLPDAAAARRFATALFALVAVVSVLAIVQVLACPASPPAWPLLGRFLSKCTRAHAFFSIYMTLAGVLTLVLLGVLPSVLRTGRALWMVPAWVAGVAALGLTYVRGAWIGFGLGVAAALWLAPQRLLPRLVLVIAVLGTFLAVPGALQRLESAASLQDNTTLDRVAMFEGGLALVHDHPVLGIGPGRVTDFYPRYAPEIAMRRHTSHLHNTPLQIAVERGVPGLGAWIAIWVAFFGSVARILRALPATRDEDRALVLGCLIAVAGFLVAGLFEYNFGDTEVLLVACSLMALPFVVANDVGGAAHLRDLAASSPRATA